MLLIPRLNCHCKRELQRPRIEIAANNWPVSFPYTPSANFSLAHDGNALYVRFRVVEDCARALVTQDQGAVWEDSCVEFFVAFDGKGYYNFEFNCIGVCLLSFREDGQAPVRASAEVMRMIGRDSTLGCEGFAERVLTTGDRVHWELNVRIPKEAFFVHRFDTLQGVEARANFYKCGDGLSKPHYLSWAPISAPSPNFHLPEFFGEVTFL